MQPLIRTNDQKIDELESAMFSAAMDDGSDVQFVNCPLNHYFTPGLYVREILMGSGNLITSEIHKTCHPFVILQGVVAVKIDDNDWQTLEAPYFGITQAGTRRVLYIIENTVWQTYHPLSFITGEENNLSEEEKENVVEKIKDAIIEPYVNKLLGGEVFLNRITSNSEVDKNIF